MTQALLNKNEIKVNLEKVSLSINKLTILDNLSLQLSSSESI